jgi:beta-glucosidase
MAGMVARGYNRVPVVAGAVPRLGIPGVRFTDGPRGVVAGASTCFPVAGSRGASWDPAMEEEIGRAIGAEARAQGANLFGGVCVNLLRHPPGGGRRKPTGKTRSTWG